MYKWVIISCFNSYNIFFYAISKAHQRVNTTNHGTVKKLYKYETFCGLNNNLFNG